MAEATALILVPTRKGARLTGSRIVGTDDPMSSDLASASAVRSPADLLNAVSSALAAQDFGAANALAQQGLMSGVEHPLLLNVAAFGLEQQGRLDDAFRLLQRAQQLAPEDTQTLISIGQWYSKAGRPGAALRAFDTALDLDPRLALAHHGRGLALAAMRDFDGALESQTAASEIEPNNTEILSALAAAQAHVGREDAARVHIDAALALDPGHPQSLVAAGALSLLSGDAKTAAAQAARALEREGLTGLHASSAYRLRADALDALGRYDEAGRAYTVANDILRSVHQAIYLLEGVEMGPELCRRLIETFGAVQPGEWKAPPPMEGEQPTAAGHVFLVGFPRSGTTLLEQVLATHPSVVALEERMTMGDIGLDWFYRDTISKLFEIDGATAATQRHRYWERVRQFGVDPKGKVFVDKLPLNSLWLPFIAKVFPDAKILFARRDPRDVILSCFRRRFMINGAMFTFTDIRHGAEFYAGVMELAEIYHRILSVNWYDHRHEDLVEDFDGETRALCKFLGLKWTKALENFAETAKRRDVQTPSAPQVRKGLYREGMAQWRNYMSVLAPALPTLEPWVERFGYDPA